MKDGAGQYSNSTLNIGVRGNPVVNYPAFPRLASAVVGPVPEYLLADMIVGPSNITALTFSTGNYSASEAGSIFSGTAHGLPITWATPVVVATFSGSVSGDALVSTPNGQTIAVAASSGGSTWVFESANAGRAWMGLTPLALSGSDPGLALGSSYLLATTITAESPTKVAATAFSLQGYGAPQVDLGPASTSVVADAPVDAAGTAPDSLGVATTTAGGAVIYYASTDGGHDYTATTIGSYVNSTAAVFQSVGDTRVDDSGATAGAVTATSQGPNVFVLYTTNIAGRSEANVTTSGNSGGFWTATKTYELPIGSIGQPEAVVSAVGYVYVTWTDDSRGIPGVDQTVFLDDGRMVQNATALPGSGGVGVSPASNPTVAIDAFMRPLYVWTAGEGSSSASLEATGAFLNTSNANGFLVSSANPLVPGDFQPPAGSHGNQPAATTSALAVASSDLSSATMARNSCLALNDTATAYGLVTPVPVSLASPPTCANLAPAVNPTSDVSGAGPTGAATFLSILGDWLFEAVGTQVQYSSDDLATVLNSPVASGSETSILPPVPGPNTTWSNSQTIFSGSGKATVTALPMNPTTGELKLSASFPPGPVISESKIACHTYSGGLTIYLYWVNQTEPVSFNWTVNVGGQSETYSYSSTSWYRQLSSGSTPDNGSTWPTNTAVYLTNLTPNAGIPWLTSPFEASYQRVNFYYDGCTGALSTTPTGGVTDESIAGFSETLYTELALVPKEPGDTFLEVTHGGAPFIDGSATGGVVGSSSGVSASLTTTYQFDTVLAFVVVGSSATTPTAIKCSDGEDLSWKTRAVQENTSIDNPGAFEVYALTGTVLSSDKITCTPNSGSSNLAMVVYAVHGSQIFDNALPSPVIRIFPSGTAETPWVHVTTNESNDLVVGMLGCGYYQYYSGNDPAPPTGGIFSTVNTEYGPPTAFVEDAGGVAAGTTNVTTAPDPCEGSGGDFGMTLIGDALAGGDSNVDAAWSNTLPAQSSSNYTSSIEWQGTQSNASWQIPEWFNFTGLPTGPASGTGSVDYNFSFDSTSQTGAWNATQEPSVSAGEDSYAVPLTSSKTCSFALQPDTVSIEGPPQVSASKTSNAATVTWYSTADGPSWLQYYELGVGLNWTQTASISDTGPSSDPYNYTVELQGLPASALFAVTAWTSYVAVPGCVSYASSSSSVFLTPGAFALSEVDLPYDSITQMGGGALIEWTVSPGLGTYGRFLNGTLFYNISGSSAVTIAPIANATAVEAGGSSYVFNASLPDLNTNYTVWLDLNYSVRVNLTGFPAWSGTFPISSDPLTFTYERDSSGDGLTDLEKILGWTVPVTGLSGTTKAEWVRADPQAYATNGLVGDYVEKEYDLNPNTVDTAGSHMLDTWNLTFLIGNSSLPANANLVIWYENSTYDPFAGTVAYSPGEFEKGYPIATNLSNISANAAHGNTSGDGASWAAEALWSYAALSTFVNLSGVRAADSLRAVEGVWHGTKTLTVWGKLSWGADPLAASTPSDGIADGQRVNPATGVALSATISNLYVTGLTTGQGYAAMFRPYVGSAVTGTPEFTNYSAPAGLGTGSGNGASRFVARLTGYTVILPVNQSSQFQTVQLEVLANEHGTSTLNHIAFDNGDEAVNLTYDMVAGAWLNESFSSPKVNGTNGSLSIQFKEVAIGGKATTYLWLPTDNGTTNGLPAGLERYVGEQSFDLVALNSSSTWTSVSIPHPWGGNYTVTVHPGLNNLLLPRAQFLNSSFAAAVLEGKGFPYPSSHPTPAILAQDTTAQGILTSAFGSSSGLMFDLEAYWQNRAIALGSTGNFTSAENGTSSTSYLQVRVVSVPSAEANNSGGLAADPAVYSASDPAPPALQAIVTLNVTSSATLDLLLAALLDNTTGAWDGVNGTLASVTNQVASLGFDAPVLSALANAPIVSEGLYGTPPYKPSSHPSGGLWGEFWNAVSAVVTSPVGAILTLVGEVWTVTLAVDTFLDHIAIEAAKIDGKLLSMSAAALVAAGKVVLGALNALLDYIVSLVKAALGQALTRFISAIDAFGLSIASSLSEAVADVTAGQVVTQTHAAAFWDTLTGSLFLTGVALATVAEVVIGIMTPFTLGATFLVGIVIGLLLSAALQALEESAVAHTSVPSSGITAFNAEAIYSCEAIVNSTNPPPRSESNWSTDWNALAGTTDWITTLFSSQLGLGLLAAAYYDRNGLVLSSVSFGLGLVGIALSIADVSTGNRLVQETNVGISITSAALDGADIVLYPADRVGPLGILNGVTLSMDSISAGIGFAEFYSEG